MIKDSEAAKAITKQSETGIPNPNIPEMKEDPARCALELFVAGKQEPKPALDEAVKQIKGNDEKRFDIAYEKMSNK